MQLLVLEQMVNGTRFNLLNFSMLNATIAMHGEVTYSKFALRDAAFDEKQTFDLSIVIQ